MIKGCPWSVCPFAVILLSSLGREARLLASAALCTRRLCPARSRPPPLGRSKMCNALPPRLALLSAAQHQARNAVTAGAASDFAPVECRGGF